jgi:hypothetical protein
MLAELREHFSGARRWMSSFDTRECLN